ncbi:MAG: hypothetical protein JW793_07055 [Acidobacteria bacterium]|nr:hypothetical protein [Acidobacteriota bacterium]
MIRKRNWLAAVIFAIGILTPPDLAADLRYVHVTQLRGKIIQGVLKYMSEAGREGAEEVRFILHVKGDRLRIDTLFEEKKMESVIYSIKDREIISLDHGYKTCSRTSFEQYKKENPALVYTSDRNRNKGTDTDEGKQPGPDTSVEDRGEEKRVNGFNSHRYTVSTRFRESGAAVQIGQLEFISDIWLCKDGLGFDEFDRFKDKLFEILGHSMEARSLFPPMNMKQDSRIQLGFEEILKLAGKMNSVPIHMVSVLRSRLILPAAPLEKSSENIEDPEGKKVVETPRFSTQLLEITNEVREISREPLEDSVFRVPDGYRLVS